MNRNWWAARWPLLRPFGFGRPPQTRFEVALVAGFFVLLAAVIAAGFLIGLALFGAAA